MNTVKQLLEKKREGKALGSAEIRFLVEGFVGGGVPDYQMSAFAMAVCCRGMTERETADLTDAMMRSGAVLEWGAADGGGLPTADKHSTGGVGDKFSFVIQPLAAACGLRVPSLVGRGLGHTGGTADKLESIPGYNASLSLEDFQRVVNDVGVSMTTQTEEICPADKKLYALRDVTGTVASIPLITASILSKKLAEGVGTLVFDVKCGRGAFMKTEEEAQALAESLVSGARAAGRTAFARVTDMSAPLGYAVGNANEIEEALSTLGAKEEAAAGVAPMGSEETGLCVEFAAQMVSLARSMPLDGARSLAQERLASGAALGKFEAMVAAHGGDLDAFRRERRKVRLHRWRISAMRSGRITGIDALAVAEAALMLGAGRERAGDAIDPHAGINFAVKRGDRVAVGATIATLATASRQDALERAAAKIFSAVSVGG
ncbi:MAG: thymidine phosphorylase [Kiritimatiellae bacterium]|nr:thymidine phosphorylase [Kiritimatiellia bacterium]